MRIIGGTLRGRAITPPANFEARPTTDFAKEGLFNILENEYDLSSLSMLDLFAGTGSISAEFISRGGAQSVCVEMNRTNALFIKKSMSSLNVKSVKTVHCNVFDFLKLCSRGFDLIFADAWPGKYSEINEILDLVKVGGFYIIDDMLTQPNWPEGHQENVNKLIEYLENREDFHLTKMNWSTGIIIATKKY